MLLWHKLCQTHRITTWWDFKISQDVLFFTLANLPGFQLSTVNFMEHLLVLCISKAYNYNIFLVLKHGHLVQATVTFWIS